MANQKVLLYFNIGGSDQFDIRCQDISVTREAMLSDNTAPNNYSDVYSDVDYMGYVNPRWTLSGSFDELQAEQTINNTSTNYTVYVPDSSKFYADEYVHIWADGDDPYTDGEDAQIDYVESGYIYLKSTMSSSYSSGDHVRSIELIGTRQIKQFVESNTVKVLVDDILAPDGVCVQIRSISVTKSSTSISPSSSSSVTEQGAIMDYEMELVETPEVVI